MQGLAIGARMAGHEYHAVRMRAVRQRHAERRGRRQARGDAIHHLHLDAPGAQVLGLLATAPEHERVAALEPHHVFALQRFGDHQLLDEGLRRAGTTAALADVDDARARIGEREHGIAHQVVDEQHRCLADHPHRLQREQFRVARPRADQSHAAGAVGCHALRSSGVLRPIAPSARIRHSTCCVSGAGAGFSPLTTDWM